MTWDVEFYQACMSDSDFSTGITTLSKEYFSDAVAPFATYQFIGGSGTPTLSGVGDAGNRLIQLNIVASTPTECETLAKNAITGVKNTLNASNINQRSLGRDSDEELHGIAVDFEVWFDTP